MRLTSIRVQNTRCLTDARLSLDDVTLVLGPNGAGKSTLAEAIRYALTGECGFTTKAGAGAARVIRHGAKVASIDLATDVATIMRTIKASGSTVAVDKLAGDEARAALEVALPAPELLRCMLSSSHFIGLPAKEQQAVLSSLAGQPVDAAWVREQLGDLASEVKDTLEATNLQGPALLDHLHSTAYGARTERNRRVKDLAGQLSGEAPVAVAEDVLVKLREAKEKASTKLAGAQQKLGAAAAQITAHEKAKAAVEETSKRLARAKEELLNLEIPEGVPTDDALVDLQRQVHEADERRRTAETNRAALSGGLQATIEQHGRLLQLDGRCPFLKDVACPLPAEELSGAVASLQQSINAMQTEEQKLASEAEDAAQSLKALRLQADEANALRTSAAAATQRHADLTADVERLAQEAEVALETYQATPAASRETLEKLVDEADEAYGRADDALQAALGTVRDCNIWTNLEKEHAAAEKAAKAIDSVVKALSPGGLPAKAMQETVGTIVEAVNRVLAEFTDFALLIETGEDFGLSVTHRGYPTPLADLSESEKLRVGIALQVAFAHLTGFGFVVVDGADRLDTTNRGPMIGMLLGCGVQALVTATPLNGGRPEAEGLAVYQLTEAGTAERNVTTDGEREAA
jgi:DNA repair exonuclease SbcCD ATPase subunit